MAKAEKCGHINRHSIGVDGKPDNLECTLPAGHSGPHSAPHHEIAKQMSASLAGGSADEFEPVRDEYGNVLYEGTPVRSWGDAAGIPPGEIVPGSPGQHLVESPHMFPEKQAEEFTAMKQELAELKQLLAKKAK